MKGSMIMGTQSGKLGNMVYYRRRGKEIARAKVTPANPRSERQARQRMLFATLTQAKSRMKEIVDHSFQGIDYGDRSLNHFQSINDPILRNAAHNPELNAAGFLPKGVKALMVNPYIISSGSLASLQTLPGSDGVVFNYGSEFTGHISGPDGYVAALAKLGCQPGDQLTLMFVVDTGQIVGTAPAGDSIYDMQLVVKRLVFKTLDEITDWTNITYFYTNNHIVPELLVADKSDEIEIKAYTTAAGQRSGFTFDASVFGADATIAGGCAIRSSLVNGQWLRSTQRLLVMDDGESWPNVSDVISSYMDVQADPESPYYLNQSQARSAQTVVGNEPYIVFGAATGGTFSNNVFAVNLNSDGTLAFTANGVVTLRDVLSSGDDFSVTGGTIKVSDGRIEMDSAAGGSMCVFDVFVDGTAVARITAHVVDE